MVTRWAFFFPFLPSPYVQMMDSDKIQPNEHAPKLITPHKRSPYNKRPKTKKQDTHQPANQKQHGCHCRWRRRWCLLPMAMTLTHVWFGAYLASKLHDYQISSPWKGSWVMLIIMRIHCVVDVYGDQFWQEWINHLYWKSDAEFTLCWCFFL